MKTKETAAQRKARIIHQIRSDMATTRWVLKFAQRKVDGCTKDLAAQKAALARFTK